MKLDSATLADGMSSADLAQVKYRHGPAILSDRTMFRLWAPGARQASLEIEGRAPLPMRAAKDGFWVAMAEDAGVGTHYQFRIGDLVFPDLASRQQAADSAGWSIVRQPLAPASRKVPLRPWHETLICEVHVGTASPEGTFAGLMQRLEHFRDAGYTCLEIMPVNEFPGSRNWGYDGTLVFAPDTAYGTPEDLRALVDHAHKLGLSMVLDVVYNHFGETDNFVPRYAPEWFNPKVETPWGPGINFDQPMVRQFYYENACMWLEEYDFDGLRFDSVQEIGTSGRELFLTELAQTAMDVKHHAKLIIENMENKARWLERTDDDEPLLFAAQWNDDIHHVLNYLVTGEQKYGYDDPTRDAYADLEKALTDGFVHDGEANGESDGSTRDEPASRLPPDAFITFVQNHDQIGNRGDSKRLPDRISAEKLDFLHFVAFLAPHIPLLFVGEEAQMRTRFPFFVDLPEAAAQAKRDQRYKQMREMFKEDIPPEGLPDPNAPETFALAKLEWGHFTTEAGRAALDRFRNLSRFRRDKVWPLTATRCLDAWSARQGNGLIVTWQFDAGHLSMAINAQDNPIDLACVIDRQPVHTGDFSQHGDVLRLGAWSAVAW